MAAKTKMADRLATSPDSKLGACHLFQFLFFPHPLWEPRDLRTKPPALESPWCPAHDRPRTQVAAPGAARKDCTGSPACVSLAAPLGGPYVTTPSRLWDLGQSAGSRGSHSDPERGPPTSPRGRGICPAARRRALGHRVFPARRVPQASRGGGLLLKTPAKPRPPNLRKPLRSPTPSPLRSAHTLPWLSLPLQPPTLSQRGPRERSHFLPTPAHARACAITTPTH